MEIQFSSKEFRDVCEQETVAIGRLGAAAAEVLKNRLADLRAADALHEVLVGSPERGLHGSVDCFRFVLGQGFVLTVVANHAPPRTNRAGNTDWARVRRIRVVALEA